MKKKQDEYHVTIAYRSVETVMVYADSESDAKRLAQESFEKGHERKGKDIVLETDRWEVSGVNNYTKSYSDL